MRLLSCLPVTTLLQTLCRGCCSRWRNSQTFSAGTVYSVVHAKSSHYDVAECGVQLVCRFLLEYTHYLYSSVDLFFFGNKTCDVIPSLMIENVVIYVLSTLFARLQAEADALFEKTSGNILYSDLGPSLPLTGRCLLETLRKWQVWHLTTLSPPPYPAPLSLYRPERGSR